MAALTATDLSGRVPHGKYVAITFSLTALGTDSATEWIATGLSNIIGILGYAVIGATLSLTPPAFQMNAQGTGVAVDVNPGDLGVEVGEAGENTLQVTVFGTP